MYDEYDQCKYGDPVNKDNASETTTNAMQGGEERSVFDEYAKKNIRHENQTRKRNVWGMIIATIEMRCKRDYEKSTRETR
jgi:hypothetical protein